MAIIFTAEQMQEMYTKNGIRSYKIHDQSLHWCKDDKDEIIKSQLKINNLILNQSLQKEELKTVKEVLRLLTDDFNNLYIFECDVCKNKQSTLDPWGIEAISMKTSWGYQSLFDTQTHKLLMCCECYNQHIMKGFLGKYVKVKHYM